MIVMMINKKNCHPTKVLYVPIIPWFKFLFDYVNDANNLMWHVNERKYDGLLWACSWFTPMEENWFFISTVWLIQGI